MVGETKHAPDPLPIDERAQKVLDDSRKAIADTQDAIAKSRELLNRLRQAAGLPSLPPHSN
jgi:hypothetical protein